MNKKLKTKIIELMLFLGSILIAIGASEFIFRLISPSPSLSFFKQGNKVSIAKSHEGLGYTFKEGIFNAKKYSSSDELIYDVEYEITKKGFRFYKPEPESFEKEISLFGGSFTFGEGLKAEHTIPYLLMDSVQQSKVNTFALSGWGVHQSIYILRNSTRKKYRSLNVLLTFPEHALRSACKPRYSHNSVQYLLQSDKSIIQKGVCQSPLVTNSLVKTLSKLKLFSYFYNSLREINKVNDDDFELYLGLIKEFVKLSRDRGQVALVVVLPTLYPDKIDIISELVIREGGDFLDLRLYDMTQLSESDYKYFLHKEDVHPTLFANKQRVSKLIKYINKIY